MKICYDNLNGFKLTSNGIFLKNGRDSYVEMDSCERCGDYYLTLKHRMSKFCSQSCACCEECHYKYGHVDECNTAVISNKICV